MKRLMRMVIYVLAAAMFLPYMATAFASADYVTKDEITGEIIYDIAGFAGSLGLSKDTAVTEGTYEELEGLSFHNGDQPLYWVAKHPRVDLYPGGYIAYTAPANGTLSVEGASNKNDSRRYVSIGTDPTDPTQTIVIPGTQTETARAGIQVIAGRTYYIMGNAAQVTAVIFTPDENSVTYCINAVNENKTVGVIDEGILNTDTPEAYVCVPRFVKGDDGAWYEMSGSPDPFNPSEASYEVMVTLDSPVINVEYMKSEETVYFAEAETIFNDTSNKWTGYSGGGYTKGSYREAQTDVIPAGIYYMTIGYKGARAAGFAQPEISANGETMLRGDLGVKVTGESSCTAVLNEDTALTINTGDRNNEIDYIHIRKADSALQKYSKEKASDKLSFKDGEVIGFIGDSITHGDEAFESYHEVLYNYLMTHYPDTKLYMKNLGVSSATGAVLLSGANGYSAIDTYLSENPEMSKAFVMLGMNDINRDLYKDQSIYDSTAQKRADALESYRENLSLIVDKLLEKNIEVILMTPTIYDATRNGSDGNLSNEGLKECAQIVKELAAEKGCKYIGLNAEMLEINETVQTVNPNLTILDAWYDNFHPGAFGNNIMGYLILRQIGEGDENIVLSSEGGQNSEVENEKVFSNYVSYEYTLSKLPMAKTDGYSMADKYVNLTEEFSSMIVKEELEDGIYELTIDGKVLGSYTASELRQGVNIAFNKENPACAAAEAAQAANIERSKYEVSLQRAVMWLVFNRYIDESKYNDIIAHKDEYINAVKDKTDEMYSIVNTELSASHKLEIRLVGGRGGLILPNMFTENMVLQEGNSSVYGKGESGTVYTVTLDDGTGNVYTATDTAKNGRFRAVITDAPASMNTYTLTVESDHEKLVINNVYVGEVYLLSGQSNMEMRFDHSYDVDDTRYREDAAEIAEKYGDRIKFLVLGNKQNNEAQFDAPILSADTLSYTPADLENSPYPDVWNNMNSATSQYISLIGMYFAEDILNDSAANKVNGPIGLLCTSVGGTDIDTWMKSGSASNYNGHIAPFEDYGIRGVLWYQGEADSETDRFGGRLPRAYKNAFPQLIDEWRNVFGEDIPFLYVQLAGYTGNDTEFQIIRDAQRRALDTVSHKNNVAMAVSADTATTGEEIIHPDGKDIVAERLYRAAKNIIYKDNESVYEGPLPESFEFKDGAAVIHFKESSVAGGLKLKEGMTELSGFKIAGSDKKFIDAKAEIAGDTVIVKADGVTEPAAVSYCDENVPELSLYNGAGLPASPFNSVEMIQVSAIGDSITYGAGLADRNTQCYPSVLSVMLNSDSELSENEYYVSNNGKNGATVTENGGNQYITYNSSGWDNARGARADIYTIALGTNDSKNIGFGDVQNGKFEEIYLGMIDELINANKNAVIYLCQPVPSLERAEDDDGEINELRLVTVRERIEAVYNTAHKKYGNKIRMIDLFGAFKSVIQGETLEEANVDMYTSPVFSSDADSVTEFNEYGTINGLYLYNRNAGSGKNELFIDTIHPGANGAALIAETIYNEITANNIEDTTKTSLIVTDDIGNEIINAGDAAAAGHINISVSVSDNDRADELIMYAAQYDENGVLAKVNMFEGIKDEDEKVLGISPDCKKIALFLWNKEQKPVMDVFELK